MLLIPVAKTFDVNRYRPDVLKTMDEKTLRKEYTKLRGIAMKRLERLSKSEFADDETYRNYSEGFPKLAELHAADIPYELTDIANFLNLKSSTITGARERRDAIIESLNKHNLGITKENFRDFYEFMNDAADESESDEYDSDQIAAMYSAARDLSVDSRTILDNFDYYMKNRDKLELIAEQSITTGTKYSSEDIKKMIGYNFSKLYNTIYD